MVVTAQTRALVFSTLSKFRNNECKRIQKVINSRILVWTWAQAHIFEPRLTILSLSAPTTTKSKEQDFVVKELVVELLELNQQPCHVAAGLVVGRGHSPA